MKKSDSVVYGMKAENFFASKMNELGLQNHFIDSWFDFLVNKNVKVEIKSCQISHKNNIGTYTIGRFDFTKKESRELQYKEDIWICFVLRHEEEFLLLGFCKAKKLNRQIYISLNNIRKLNLVNIKEWMKIINN